MVAQHHILHHLRMIGWWASELGLLAQQNLLLHFMVLRILFAAPICTSFARYCSTLQSFTFTLVS
jgi:hypothetical protein